ncbi:hypothetical protein BST22_26265 [Mycolicibacterium chubuense]|nr:hypothetical protein BST22_26265 [Mycolicibacterium chubuense]
MAVIRCARPSGRTARDLERAGITRLRPRWAVSRSSPRPCRECLLHRLLHDEATVGHRGWRPGRRRRVARPEALLTLEDIDRHKVTTVLGKVTAQAMKARR